MTTVFQQTRDELIADALGYARVIAQGEVPDAATNKIAATTLNMMIKQWQSVYHIWTTLQAVLYLQPNQNTYTLGSNSTDHATELSHETTLTVAAVSTDTSITVVDSTNITIGDNIGILKDDKSLFWTTVTNVVASVVTLNDALDGDAGLGNKVVNYTTSLVNPLRVPSARHMDANGTSEIPIVKISNDEYFNLPNKTSTSIPTQFYYQPLRVGNGEGRIYLWPTPQDSTTKVTMTFEKPIDVFDNGADLPDFPPEWHEAISLELAKRLNTKYGLLQGQDIADLKENASKALELVLSFDQEIVTIQRGVGRRFR